MQKVFVLISMMGSLCHTAFGQAAKDAFTLSGQFSGSATPYVYLSYVSSAGKRVWDSAAVSNGRFFFKGAINEPVLASLQGKVASRSMEDPNYTTLYLEPGAMTVTVQENAFKSMRVTGSKTQQDLAALEKQKQPLQEQWKPFFRALDSVNKIDNFKFQEMKAGLQPYHEEMKKIDFSYIHAHPTSYLTARLLMGYLYDLPDDTLGAYYARFPEKLRASQFGTVLKTEIDRRKTGIPGTMAAGFEKTDIEGQPLKLSDYRGKYVLLDFWASWCLPCRKGNPHLRALYRQYGGKGLEIIGVSDDDSKPDAWRKAVAHDSIGIWKHVLRGLDIKKKMAGQKNEHDLSEQYGIASLPTKILIDPQGKIIGRYSGDGEKDEALDRQLQEIFKN